MDGYPVKQIEVTHKTQTDSSNSKQTASPADRQGRQTSRLADRQNYRSKDRQTDWMDGWIRLDGFPIKQETNSAI